MNIYFDVLIYIKFLLKISISMYFEDRINDKTKNKNNREHVKPMI